MNLEQGYYEKSGYERFKTYTDYRKEYKSLCAVSQISFLLGVLSDYKFSNKKNIENVLEVGVYNGVTSLYMLKEGCKSRESYKQYGIDIGKSDFIGEAAIKESTPEEKEHFFLHKNSTALDIESVVPSTTKLDMVFIDAGHSHPHPIIDLICVIPYLHDESIVMLHDVIDYMKPNAWGESFIFAAWKASKYRNINIFSKEPQEETLGVIEIPKDKNELYDLLLTVAKLPFRAAPWKFDDIYLGINEQTIQRLHDFMLRHYDKDFTEKIIKCFYTNLENYRNEWVLRVHETRFYNYLFETTNNIQSKISALESKNKTVDTELKSILSTIEAKNKIVDTELKNIQQQLDSINYVNPGINRIFWQKIFSVKNEYAGKQKHKIITLLGLKIKIKEADMSAASHTDLQQ